MAVRHATAEPDLDALLDPVQTPVLSMSDIAFHLGCSPLTVRRMYDDGIWPDGYKRGRNRFVPTAAYRRWLQLD